MITKRLFRPPLHEHAEPAMRVQGAAELPPDSSELARLVTSDPAPEVRVAAAVRCADVDALTAAWEAESDPAVRAAIGGALGPALAATPRHEAAAALLASAGCPDSIRAEVALRALDADRRRAAIAALRDEAALVEVALAAEHAETRLAAAERVHSPEGLRRLADGARNKDHGVARLARKRIDAIADRAGRAAEADALLPQLEALATSPDPILTAVVELNRRWQALDIGDDAARVARADAARQALQQRFDRENDEQRTRARFVRRLHEWTGRREPPATAEALAGLRGELAALREEAAGLAANAALAELDDAEQRIARWAMDLEAQAAAAALVAEAEQLAAGTSIDDAKLPERWQALDRALRTPQLTRRFEAALIAIEQRRLAQVHAAKQKESGARQRVHTLLHAAEQALAAGQLQAARLAADEIRTWKPDAGALPKPTTQRLGRVVAQLAELERWESFGQRHARVQLCERAEAAAAAPFNASQVAAEVRQLRESWKALDRQHAGVPKALWERFDRACETAYAPAARHFAEVAAQKKDARRRRDEFIAAAAAHAQTLLPEPRDWRAIEQWLRETDRAWRDGDLGSLDPKTWRAFDGRLKAAVAPLRDALAAARGEARSGRQALIDEARTLAGAALERDAPTRVKALQARWQAHAKALALPQRDEQALWEQFRAACNAVFAAREAQRKEAEGVEREAHLALEAICTELVQLAAATDKEDGDVRRELRELDAQWRRRIASAHAVPRAAESRFRSAKAAVESALSSRARSREAAVWDTLAAKERLCDELDALARSGGRSPEGATAATAQERWSLLPPLPPAWEKRMLARRDAALAALAGDAAAAGHASRMDRGSEARSRILLELELSLGLESPAELHAQRLALQVNQLRQRFQDAATPGVGAAGERLLAWCAESGTPTALDRKRCERVFAAIGKAR